METYRSGHNEPDSKSGCPQGHVSSNLTVSAINNHVNDDSFTDVAETPLIEEFLCVWVQIAGAIIRIWTYMVILDDK